MKDKLQAEKHSQALYGNLWQVLSILLCAVFAVLMILNTQMSGEAMWFWYGTAFRDGAKIYSQLHTALQPLFVLEIGTWIRLFGSKLVVYEIPSLLHATILAIGICFVLRESSWPGWQKAIILLGSFVLTVDGHSYRFDDYHVVAEFLIVYALALLLQIGRPIAEDKWRSLRVALLGMVCGLTFVTRLTDGAALVVACLLTLPFLLRETRLARLALFAAATAGTVFVVILLSGDSVSAYASNSIFRAAASKGGTGSIFAAPLLVIANTIPMLGAQKKVTVFLLLLFVVGFLVAQLRPRLTRYLVALELLFSGLVLLVCSRLGHIDFKRGVLFEDLVLLLTVGMYPAAAVILFRVFRSTRGQRVWDRREVLILLPILEWASYSAGAAAEPLTNYYAPVALLLLLIPVLRPARARGLWLNLTVVTIMGLLAVDGIVTKVLNPYAWQNYRYNAMFKGRQIYHHPVYGFMYIDRDLLRFSEQLCADIGAQSGAAHPDLLSLPYPYPNYFCATKPWHNYVQTFFDTTTRGAMNQLMGELQTAPPEWIVYQRQTNIMNGAERLYNHGQPIPQRHLDEFIADKLQSGTWTLVDFSDYLQPESLESTKGTGWYVIHTKR